MALYKFGVGASFITLGITIVYTHYVARLFPVFPAGVSAAIGLLMICGVASRRNSSLGSLTRYVLPIVVVALTSRVYLFLFPGSLIGVDPPQYAVEITRLIQVGQADAIGFYFYSRIPLMLLFQAMFGMITDLSAPNLMILYSIILGVLVPLVVTSLTVWVAPQPSKRMATIAACIGSSTSLLINFGNEPVAQTLGVIYWIVLLVVLARFFQTRSKPDFLFAVLTMLALTFTHKLPLLIVLLLIVSFALLSAISSMANLSNNEQYIAPPYGVILGVLAAALIVIEWAFLTTFFKSVVSLSINIFLTESIDISPPLTRTSPTAAIPVDQGVTGILSRRGHGLTLLALGGAAWMYTGYKRIDETIVRFLIACVAVPVALLMITVVGNPPGEASPPSIPRILVFVEPAVVPIIVVTFGRLLSGEENAHQPELGRLLGDLRSLIVVLSSVLLIGLIVTSQLFTPFVVPDYPDNPRRYLTAEEVHAKQFGYEYVDESIRSDWYLTVAGPPNPGTGADTPRYEPIGKSFLDADMANISSQYGRILYRANVDYYLTDRGPWSLVWDPEEEFNREYNRIYSNDDAILYERDIGNRSVIPAADVRFHRSEAMDRSNNR
jgi:hypothetical protein